MMTLGIFAVGVFFAVPDSWILDYRSITVEDACTTDKKLVATSERFPNVTVTGRGEDNIYVYPLNGDFAVDRIQWDDATYRKGTVGDRWIVPLHRTLDEGQYILVGEPIIKFMFLERPIDAITSKPFTISVCQ